MKDFRLAAIQMNAGFGRNAGNLDVHETYIAQAAEAGARREETS